jgi:hypothetical protein
MAGELSPLNVSPFFGSIEAPTVAEECTFLFFLSLTP